MYEEYEDVEKMFNNDSRYKKSVGRNISKRASRKGYCRGGVKTPSDFMSKKEKNKLNSEVRVYNMYEKYNEISNCKADEIFSKSKEEVKAILTLMKSKHRCREICQAFGVSNGKLYSLYDDYGVEYTKRPMVKETIKTNKITNEATNICVKEEEIKQSNGFKLEYNGVYTKEELSVRLLSLDSVTIDGYKYKVNITLEEVE